MSQARHIASRSAAGLWLAWGYAALHPSVPELRTIFLYSTGYFGLLAGYFLIAALVTALVFLLGYPWGRFITWAKAQKSRLAAAAVGIGAIVWLALPFKDQAKIFPTVLLLIILWQVFDDADPSVTRCLRRSSAFALVILAVGVILQGVSLLYFPIIHVHDEGAYAHIAMTYMRTGMLSGEQYGFPPRYYIGFGSWLVALGHWLTTFGFGWTSARLFSFTAALLSIPVLGLAAAKWFDRRAAVFTMIFLGLSAAFIETHRIRPDSSTILLVSASLCALAFAYRDRLPRWYALTGFFAALSLEAHLMTAAHFGAYAVLLGGTWLFECYRARRLKFPTGLFWFGVGAVPPALIFVLSHIVPDLGKPSGIMVTPQPRTIFDMLVKEATRWWEYLTMFPLDALLVILALIVALRAQLQRSFPILAVVGVLLVAYIVIAPTEWFQYTLYFLPFMALLVGQMLSRLPSAMMLLAVVCLGASVALGAGKVITSVSAGDLIRRPIPPVVEFVADNFPEGSRVAMNVYYYLYFDSGDRYTYLNPSLNPPRIEALGGVPQDELWVSLDLDVIVFNNLMDERTVWFENFLAESGYVHYDGFDEPNIDIYLPPDSPLLGG